MWMRWFEWIEAEGDLAYICCCQLKFPPRKLFSIQWHSRNRPREDWLQRTNKQCSISFHSLSLSFRSSFFYRSKFMVYDARIKIALFYMLCARESDWEWKFCWLIVIDLTYNMIRYSYGKSCNAPKASFSLSQWTEAIANIEHAHIGRPSYQILWNIIIWQFLDNYFWIIWYEFRFLRAQRYLRKFDMVATLMRTTNKHPHSTVQCACILEQNRIIESAWQSPQIDKTMPFPMRIIIAICFAIAFVH